MATPYYMDGGLQNLGQAADAMPSSTPLVTTTSSTSGTLLTVWWLASLASIGLSAYHGYRRSRGSVGAAVGWGILGGIFPLVVPLVAMTQGYAEPLRRNRRRRRKQRTR